MPSIFDMFDDPADAPAGAEPLGFDEVLDRVISQRPVAGRPTGYDPDGEVSAPDGGTSGAEGGVTEPPASVPPQAPTSPPPAEPVAETPPADPLGDLSDLERLELSQLRQALSDPDRGMAVRRALLGVEAPPAPAPPAAVVPSVPTAPQMPEEIMPGSIEAQLWHDNQEMKAQIAEIRQGQQSNREQTEAQARNDAAIRATQAFGIKYAGRLSENELMAIAQTAGMRKLPDAFRPTTNNWDDAMTQALEFELRSNDVLLGKVLGMSPTPGSATPPTTQRPPEGQAAGRKLTALSSAASPSGESAQRVPIESRNDATGKMTERSRMALVQEMINGDGSLRGSPGEGIS